jgi:hypothetical protein
VLSRMQLFHSHPQHLFPRQSLEYFSIKTFSPASKESVAIEIKIGCAVCKPLCSVAGEKSRCRPIIS